jgi:hypothetical protein
VFLSFARKEIDVLPAHSLTPQALVIALSPLLDERGVRALLDLRRRGFDLVVVELSPIAFARERDAQPDLSIPLWRLWREALRFRTSASVSPSSNGMASSRSRPPSRR